MTDTTDHRRRFRAAWRLAATAGCTIMMLGATPVAEADAGHSRNRNPIRGTCTGNAPIICTYDVAPGHYDVTVRLGSRHRAGTTAVYAEARRLMVAPVDTRPGRHITRSFTVNVRAPEGQQNDFGVPGTPGLTLTFAGADPAVADLRVVPAARSTHRLFLIGDSTVTDQENSPYTGLGQRLPAEIRRGVSVVNHSGSGESTVSYLADPRLWATLRPQIRRGDVALVQLAHNDKTTTADTYRANLQTMIDGIRQRGGRPVLVTPIVRHRFTDGKINSTGLIVNNLGVDLPAEIRAVAAQQHVPLIDLTAKSESLLESLGPDAAEPIYLIREIGDRTHTSEYGATVYAGMVADELRRYDLTVQ